MGIPPLRCLGEFVDDVLRRGPVRISHTEIDDILSARPSCSLQLIDNVEYVGGQASDSGKFVHEQCLICSSCDLTDEA